MKRTDPGAAMAVSALSLVLVCLFASAEAAVQPAGEKNWPQFRGPGGSAVSESGSPPVSWSDSENVVWVRDIPGRGWSSPIVWGDRRPSRARRSRATRSTS
ncbi:MAG: hypothetical protein ACRD21_15170 [Vicinamibacteria bacterium]